MGVFHPLKIEWGKVCHDWIDKHPGRIFTKFQFSELLHKAWTNSIPCKCNSRISKGRSLPLQLKQKSQFPPLLQIKLLPYHKRKVPRPILWHQLVCPPPADSDISYFSHPPSRFYWGAGGKVQTSTWRGLWPSWPWILAMDEIESSRSSSLWPLWLSS